MYRCAFYGDICAVLPLIIYRFPPSATSRARVILGGPLPPAHAVSEITPTHTH